MSTMTNTRTLFGMIGEAFAIIGAAGRASAAVEAHRKPDAASLRTLGIDPAAFSAKF